MRTTFPFDPRLLRLREELRGLLESYGYGVDEDWNLSPPEDLRAVLAHFARLKNPKPDPKVARYFASASEVNPLRIRPVLRPVENQKESRIFRHAASFWSVPISNGFGRRMRFILWDDHTGKVMGILGLTDPVIGLGVRDRYIGWNKEVKEERLYHVMTAYILGAVPPYNRFRVAKLVALLAGSEEVHVHFKERYERKRTVIQGKVRPAKLVLVDTMGAFGKSAIYNRLKGWNFVGYTKGKSHYHLSSNGIFPILIEALKIADKEDILKRNRYGQGPNWKLRIVREASKILGIPDQALMGHGLRRAYYIYPLAENWKPFLRGEVEEIIPIKRIKEELFAYWRERWLLPLLSRAAA